MKDVWAESALMTLPPEHMGSVSSLRLDQLAAETMRSIPGCVAISLVDMTTGLHLACQMVQRHNHVALMAAAARDMYFGPTVREFEALWNETRRRQHGTSYFQDITVHSENMLHIFLRGRVNADHVLVLVCRSSTSLGLALTKARAALPAIEAAV